jgi:hypothetical protein
MRESLLLLARTVSSVSPPKVSTSTTTRVSESFRWTGPAVPVVMRFASCAQRSSMAPNLFTMADGDWPR